MSHRRAPHHQTSPVRRSGRGVAVFVSILSLFVSVGLGVALVYDVHLLGGPELVSAGDLSLGWSLLRKAIVVAPGVVTAYAIVGLTRRRNLLSIWLGLMTIVLGLHVPLLPDHAGPAVLVSIGAAQGAVAFVLSRSSRFVEGLRSYEPPAA